MKHSPLLASLAAAALLSGCGSLPTDMLANRVSCTLDRKEGLVSSMYGAIGITSKVYAADAAVMCAAPAPPFRPAEGLPVAAAGAAGATALPVVKPAP